MDKPELPPNTIIAEASTQFQATSGVPCINSMHVHPCVLGPYTRLMLYMLIAMVGSLVSELTNLKSMEVITGFDWAIAWCKIALPGLITWRAFIDKSMARLDNSIK